MSMSAGYSVPMGEKSPAAVSGLAEAREVSSSSLAPGPVLGSPKSDGKGLFAVEGVGIVGASVAG
jgi:hypothetical protein